MKQDNWKSVKRIEPLPLAKTVSVITGLLYLLLSILVTIISYIPQAKLQLPAHPLLFIISTPVYGFIGGFVFSYAGALLYNKLSRYIGTIKVELE